MGKTPVFGLLKRGDKVFVKIVPNCSKEELMPDNSMDCMDTFLLHLKETECSFNHKNDTFFEFALSIFLANVKNQLYFSEISIILFFAEVTLFLLSQKGLFCMVPYCKGWG